MAGLDKWRWPVQLQGGGGNVTYTDRIRVVQLGDGYSQAVAEGINPIIIKPNIVYTGRTEDVTAARDFLNSHKATPFAFAPPGGVLGLYTVVRDSVNYTQASLHVATVTAQLEQNFGFYNGG